LHPTDSVDCDGHVWSVVEIDDAMLILQCQHCASWSTVTIDALG
jgi:hypothetical protein